jgi:uncharacterized membrane protein YphA (DoxX/SURF4 family)
MGNLLRVGQWFFALCLAGLAGEQFYYGDFRPVFVPHWASPMPGQAILAYLFSFILLAAAIALVLEKKARTAMLLLGGLFLALVLFCHIPYELLDGPSGHNLGSWTHAFKELAFAGSAFVLAGSFPHDLETAQKEPGTLRILETFIPFGGIFFSAMLVAFGIDHFLYADWVSTLVPNWIPGHLFWTYFAGVTLIGGGLGIGLQIKKRTTALLTAIMIFIWFLILHIPRAIVAPAGDNGNELNSVFESLGFSGVALVIAYCWVGPRMIRPRLSVS